MALFDAHKVRSALEADPAFQLSARLLTGCVRFEVGEIPYLLTVNRKLSDFVEGDQTAPEKLKPSAIFTGDENAWKELLDVDTPPGRQSILYNDGRSGVRCRSDWITEVAPFATLILEFFRVLRTVVTQSDFEQLLPEVERDQDSIIGRYMYVRIQGVQYRVYYEEAGRGPIPLLLQHTAGADGRQYRHILEDSDFQKHFRMIAYDLPFHGRSLPPTSHKWWNERYVLDSALFKDSVFAISDKLGLDRPVFIGSAMGAYFGLDVAYHSPEKFRAVICLNAGVAPQVDDVTMERLAGMSSPAVSNQFLSAQFVANMAGTSPGVFRRELGWIYNQAAAGIPEGAVYYYCRDFSLTLEQIAAIDTSKIAVYVFTGQDDSMGGAWGAPVLAEAAPNIPVKVLKRLGHFGAAENPQAFKEDIWPALQEIIERSTATKKAREVS